MPSATVTIRELRNKHTGIDISIPRFTQEKGLLQTTYQYQVVVVTNLPYFKSPKHRESDVVQYMVSKKFSDFEDLWSRLFEKHHSIVLPPLPKKSLLVSDKVATERRASLEKFLGFLASSPKVCTSPLLLEFLGVNAIKAGKYTKEGVKAEEENENETKDKEGDSEKGTKSGLFGEEEEEEETEDIFNDEEDEENEGPEVMKQSTFDSTMTADNGPETRLFEYPVIGGNLRANEDFFQHEDEEQIQDVVPAAPDQEDNNSELLTVQDDLDELFLDQSKSKSAYKNDSQNKPKPALKPKPGKSSSDKVATSKPKPKAKPGAKSDLKPKPTSAETNVRSESEAVSAAADLDTDDIMKYIQSAEGTDEDVDLFN